MKKIIAGILAGMMLSVPLSAFTMPTSDFDRGMANGINYFNRGLYYEAQDEFNWFKARYEEMNQGQQKYLDDYIYGTKCKISQHKRNSVVGWWFNEVNYEGMGKIHSTNIQFKEDMSFYSKTWRVKKYGTYRFLDDNTVEVSADTFIKFAGCDDYMYYDSETEKYVISGNKLILISSTNNGETTYSDTEFESKWGYTEVEGQI